MPSSANDATRDAYDRLYSGEHFYWTTRPSETCFEVLRRMPPTRHVKLLDVGCGEGRNAVFFARNGYDVHAFDISAKGIDKTRRLAESAAVRVNAFQAELSEFRLRDQFDVVFSTGVLHSCDPAKRAEIIANYQSHTTEGGLHVLSVFVEKPFIAPAPDRDPNAHQWRSGDLLGFYADWLIEWSVEEIFDCMSSGVPHKHAVNRIAARKPGAGNLG